MLALPALVFVVWAITAAIVDNLVFPGPLDAIQGLVSDFGREAYRESIVTTIRLLLLSWAISVVAGALIGFGLGMSRFWSQVFATPMFAFYCVPLVTLYPVFILFLGIGEQSRVVFAIAHGLPPMALLVMGATVGIDKNLLKLADALKLPWYSRLTKIIIPALIPTLASGARIALGLTMIGLILAGMVSATSGLGHELVNNIANARVARITGQVVFIIVLAVIPGLFLRWLERRLSRHR
ncbi:ABC-type nitrate/sulfonate/bicarbonate transport system permease component OS=Castellaniella defragrans OX=75697 GN=HNR28_003475 PE=3 SV=1 [Castellaniella defragrans]